MSDYKITEQDIEGMLHYLHVFHPENENREYAQAMLEILKATYRNVSLADPDKLDDIYDTIEKSSHRPAA